MGIRALWALLALDGMNIGVIASSLRGQDGRQSPDWSMQPIAGMTPEQEREATQGMAYLKAYEKRLEFTNYQKSRMDFQAHFDNYLKEYYPDSATTPPPAP